MTRPDPTHRDESLTPPPDQPATPLTSPNGTAHQADALDRFWDDLSRSAVAALPDAPADLAPERAATVAQVHSLATIQIPMGARSRVWQATLARANVATHRQEHPPMRTVPLISDRLAAVAVPPPIPERRTRRTSRGWWPRVEVAVAAVLIVGLLTTLLSPSGQQRLGLFGDDNSEQQRDVSFSGGATIIEVPESDNGHTLALYEMTLEPGAAVKLPPSDWTIRPVDSSIELTRVFAGDERTEVVNADSVTGSDASTSNRLRNYLDEPVVVWLIAFAGDTPPTIPTAAGTSVEVLATLELTGLESGTFVELTTITRPGEAEPAGIAPREQPGLHLIHVPGSQTGGIVYTARGEVEVANVGDFPNGGPVVVPAGESVTFLEGNHATVRGLSAPTQDEAYPDVYLAVTVRPVAAAENATPQVASLTMDVPADAPLQLVLRRIELQPGTEWGYDFEGSVLIWVESGFATVQFDDHRMEQLFPGRAEFPPVFAQSGSGELRLGTGGDGNEPTVLYQLLAFTEPDINVAMGVAPGTYSSVGRFDSENLHYISDVQLPPGQAEISLSYSQITGSHPFGNGSDLSIVSVTDGSGYVSTGTSEVILSRTEPISGVGGNSTVGVYEPIIGHHDLSTGMTVTGMPGSLFSVGTQSDQPMSVIVANVTPFEGPLEGPATPAVATPAAATPASGTPPVYEAGLDDLGEPGCDVPPRTPDDLVRLLEEGQANPVDPATLSLRGRAGTGTPADQATADAIMAMLREYEVCYMTDNVLGYFALYTDEGLRALLPLSGLDAEDLAGIPTLPVAAESGDRPNRPPVQLLVSEIEVFPDGRAGASVSFFGAYVYVTFSQQPDGRWLIDVFDRRPDVDDDPEYWVPPTSPVPIVTPISTATAAPTTTPTPGATGGDTQTTPTPEAGTPMTVRPVGESMQFVEAFGDATLPVPASANGHSILAAEVTIPAGQEWTIPNAAAQIVVLGRAVTVQTDAEGSRAETFAASESTTLEGNLTLQARNTDARFLMLVIVGDGSWIGHPPNDITTTPILLYNGIRLESGEMARLAIGQLLVTEYGIVEPPSRATSTTPAAATGTPASVPLPSQIVVDIHVVEGEAQIGQRVVRASDPSPSVTYSVQLDEQTVQQGMDVLQIRATSDQPAVVWYVTIQVSGNAPLTG